MQELTTKNVFSIVDFVALDGKPNVFSIKYITLSGDVRLFENVTKHIKEMRKKKVVAGRGSHLKGTNKLFTMDALLIKDGKRTTHSVVVPNKV